MQLQLKQFHHRLLLDSSHKYCKPRTTLNKYLVLMVEKFLHTFFLAMFECSIANLVHDEKNSLIPVPQVLLHQYSNPELQNGCGANAARLSTLQNMTLENRKNRDKSWRYAKAQWNFLGYLMADNIKLKNRCGKPEWRCLAVGHCPHTWSLWEAVPPGGWPVVSPPEDTHCRIAETAGCN